VAAISEESSKIPTPKSRWAAMVRKGKKVMQFGEGGRYVVVVADGKYLEYARRS
jgi:hypothetical protein